LFIAISCAARKCESGSGPVGEADGANAQVHREVAGRGVVSDEYMRASATGATEFRP
jgi:hypothetical protein